MDPVEAERHQVAAPLSTRPTAALAGHNFLAVKRHAGGLLRVAAGRGAAVTAGGAAAAPSSAAHHGGQVESNLERLLHTLWKFKNACNNFFLSNNQSCRYGQFIQIRPFKNCANF